MNSTNINTEPVLLAETQLLSPSEFGKLVGLGPESIRAKVKTGFLKAIRLNSRCIRIPRSEINKLLTCCV